MSKYNLKFPINAILAGQDVHIVHFFSGLMGISIQDRKKIPTSSDKKGQLR